ncbi:bifunctional DNA-formamidopyrimidine glycosylase/DNA-(apurinic or apyrimidinic site) lyase [Hoeflea prorocentri]|uniref:Formamidopyrimidine-DNA glycosylase n=1 Tax=Hoeflea prorocentri TaxID=1922333 RepID=A0A9X3ZJI5_9HYPH|nr:bifunctional DNA-formamidopyrimidine glycosylase/DNA-(apurinic or apyrimidinic site) lyase [Hoeflea prorocentri]MCY6382830.1 bifunctional DNA-formamidopyrimidine glycosylase/DNA-(apurinic or apyrimidinic site) lyase [Hoeflea prorocentri]MDA5400630.1 bifunctional DNA-formamidopyrimidine glycosylase/DNA-(apurinic or apyrimidinic site) lyase [Hoeflea prorocentri]
MPELPEVETVRRGLQPAMEGAVLRRLEQRRPDLRFALPENFAERLEGRRIVSLRRRAKYLLVHFDDESVLISHLGMSGSYHVADAGTPGQFHHDRSKDEKHDHVVFELDGPDGRARVIYNDPRRFGFMLLTSEEALDDHPLIRDLGVEPTGNALSAQYLAGRFAGKKAPLKAALLDQKIIAGLGNIYVCEALWRAHLSPRRAARTLVTGAGAPVARLEDLTRAIRAVIDAAIAAGGSSLRDHRQADGTLGYFQHSFSTYDREGEPCARSGCGGYIRRIVQSGRSTFFCPACQR